MQNLGWTTLEQSKKLIEAGLDPETADMLFYIDLDGGLQKYELDEITEEHLITEVKGAYCYDSRDLEYYTIPCWSLGQLIGLIPKDDLMLNSNGWCLYAHADGVEDISHEIQCDENGEDDGSSSLMDNVVAMVIWLLENGYIKKGETNG